MCSSPGPTTIEIVRPEWPAPPAVHALTTTRIGGVSPPPFDSLNLGLRAGDEPAAVRENRRRLSEQLRLPSEPLWLRQVHGTRVIDVAENDGDLEADGAIAKRPGLVCTVLTADCLPVLLCDRRGREVAAAHAGWRGLAAGVVQATVKSLSVKPTELIAWLGPSIGPAVYEVGTEVRDAFLDRIDGADACFRRVDTEHWLADLPALARGILQRLGVRRIHESGLCTFSDARRFFSYRRDGPCGRLASLIWIET